MLATGTDAAELGSLVLLYVFSVFDSKRTPDRRKSEAIPFQGLIPLRGSVATRLSHDAAAFRFLPPPFSPFRLCPAESVEALSSACFVVDDDASVHAIPVRVRHIFNG